MRKGVTGERMVFLIVAVCLGLFVLWFLLSRIAPSLLQQLNWLLGFDKPTNIELATMCAIYRCANGCMYMRVQEISWKNSTGTVYCQEFCGGALPSDAFKQEPCTCQKELIRGVEVSLCGGSCENAGITCADDSGCESKIPSPEDLKVCDPNYPVTITLKKDEKINIDHLALGSPSIPDVSCIMSTNDGGIGAWDTFLNVIKAFFVGGIQTIWAALGGASDNFLVVDAGLIKSYGDKVECNMGVFKISDSLKELIVRGGQEIKIVTEMKSFGLSNIATTYVKK